MKHIADTFQAQDGLTIHTQSWLPDGDPTAVVLVAHGLAEHIGRYAHVAAFLTQRGWVVCGPDHRGHGRTGGLRAYFERFEQPVDDLERYLDQVRAAYPGKKLFLYAHSLGTLISYQLIFRRQHHLAGFIVSGTPLDTASTASPLLVRASALLDPILPTLPATPLDSAGLAHDPQVVAAYDSDPLVHRGKVRVRMGNFIVSISEQVRARLAEICLPLLVIHGADDPICPASGSAALYEGAGSPDKTLKIYPGLLHEIHNEPQQDAVLADIAAWIQQRL